MNPGCETITGTYTDVDVRRVFESVEATLRMAVTRTGLKTPEWATNMAHDLRHFAESNALEEAHLMLFDGAGAEIHALVFEPSDAAAGWAHERPKADTWPRLPSGTLEVVVKYTASFAALPSSEQRALKDGCMVQWTRSSRDTSHSGLRTTRSQQHASSGFGVKATSYRR